MDGVRVGRRAAIFPDGYVERALLYRVVYFAALLSSRLRALLLALPPSRPKTAVTARVVHSLFEDWSDGKLVRVMRVIHPDAELEMPGALGTYSGDGAVRRGWDAVQESFPGGRLSVREWIHGEGNTIVVCLAADMKGGSSGIPINDDLYGVWEHHNGFGRRLRLFDSKPEALEAVGLSE